ncbi:MAG: IclR family transcriptional regulator [Acetivibrionales bacterium]|jgi:IclR family KDG regulon transcriptional repressor
MIKAVDKALTILDVLEKEKLAGVTEIANIIGVNKSSAHRILATLETKELVEKDEATKKYKLGLGFLRYSTSVLENIEISKVAKPFLEDLVGFTQESAHLCVLSKSKNKAVFVEQKKSSEIISISGKIGDEEPVYCSAVGKNLIAFLPEEELKRIIDTIEFKPFTLRTITSKQALIAHLEKIREQGYAVDDEEIYNGVRCVAAPVRNHKGKVIASVGVSGPANRIQLNDIEKYASAVKDIAAKISRRLGYKS